MDENKSVSPEKPVSEQPKTGKMNRVLPILLRILTSVLTVLLIALSVYLVVNRDRFNLDSLKRYLTYRSLERSDGGRAPSFSIGQDDELCYATISDAVVLCSQNRIQVYSDGGVLYEDISCILKHPVIQTASDYTVVYDAGGNELYLFADRQSIFHYTSESGYALISARVNARGWLSVVEQASGYKGSVTIYNDHQEPVVTERISSQFVSDAAVSPDNRQVAVLTIGQDGTDFASTITLYQTSDGTQSASAVVADSPILDLQWDNSGLWLQHQFGIIRVNNHLERVTNWNNVSLYLQGYSLGGDGFAVEYFSRDRSGSLAQLVSVDTSGNVLGTMNISREILSVTAAGRYIAVLTGTQLSIYTSDFTQYATLSNDSGILSALMRPDGTAMLIEGEEAGVYLP